MTRKLKPDRGIQGMVPAIISIVFFILNLILFNLRIALFSLGTLMIIYAIVLGYWSFHKSGNYYILISTFYMITLGLVFLTIEVPKYPNGPAPFFIQPGHQINIEFKLALLFTYVFMFWIIYLVFQKKLKYRGREIMELAAWDVEEGPNTYTERPRPAGKTDYSKYDIIDFANYMKKILACMAYQEDNRILLVPIKAGKEYAMLYNPRYDYLKQTWISFDFDGQVSVHISQKDYLDFKDDLAFDHLCESLGQLMITFADFYISGSKIRILDRLNSVKIGLFS